MMKENIMEIEQRILSACKRSNRARSEITLIAVSKTKSLEMIEEAAGMGLLDFGENKVQELCEKTESIRLPLHWHFIGHLQRNKVKYIVDKVRLIHSVDSYRLAEQIDTEAAKKNISCKILLEINVAEEVSKFGIKAEETERLIREVSGLKHISVCGLMTVAPFTENAEENRLYFRKMKQLCVDIKQKNIDNVTMDMLSMGMTGDYEIAIEEGATHVRIGTGIFGGRNYG